MRLLITGVSGQDGYYLARQALEVGHEVFGTSRRFKDFDRELVQLYTEFPGQFTVVQCDPLDAHDVLRAISVAQPDEVYHMGGLSHVGLAFAHPSATYRAILDASLILLEALHSFSVKLPRVYLASSSEMFGNSSRIDKPLEATDPMLPVSPYGLSKLAVHQAARFYRDVRGMHVTSGIAFNHESPRRSPHFVTKTIAQQAVAVARGQLDKVQLGNLAARRDWGWAPEYTGVMSKLLRLPDPVECVLCTGESASVADFAHAALVTAFADRQGDFLRDTSDLVYGQEQTPGRDQELYTLQGEPAEAEKLLGWRAAHHWGDVARMMVESELEVAR